MVGGLTIADLGGTASRLPVNIGAAVVGSLIVAVAGRRSRAVGGWSVARSTAVGLGAVVAITASILVGGRDGVHRWAGVGSVQVHLSLLLTPLVVLAAGRLAARGHAGTAVLLVLALQVVHVAQPDGAQAVAVAAASIALASNHRVVASTGHRIVLALGAVILAAAAWVRPDPLLGVADVEDVLQSAASISPVLGIAAGLAVVVLLVPFALDWSTQAPTEPGRGVVLALGAYVTGTLAAAQLGEFPVLVAGYGVSTVLGYFSAAACAVAAVPLRTTMAETPEPPRERAA